jgi:hypothetical protein
MKLLKQERVSRSDNGYNRLRLRSRLTIRSLTVASLFFITAVSDYTIFVFNSFI